LGKFEVTAGENARAVVERYLAALNRHDTEAVVECVATEFLNEHTSALGTSVRGRDAYRDRLPEFFARFEHLRYEPEDFIVDSDRVAVPYTLTCTVCDNGAVRPLRLRGMFRFRVEDGHIVHRVDYWDGREFERQTQTMAGGGLNAGAPQTALANKRAGENARRS
jgi:steroid delta-isomerase-like uncharacterized protein